MDNFRTCFIVAARETDGEQTNVTLTVFESQADAQVHVENCNALERFSGVQILTVPLLQEGYYAQPLSSTSNADASGSTAETGAG